MNETIMRECTVHGLTEFRICKARSRGRCRKCAVDAVIKRRRVVKQKAIEYLGGKCEKCNQEYHPAIFEFHHKDPAQKDFTISRKGHCSSWETIKEELNKCLLLCANCHRLEHVKMD